MTAEDAIDDSTVCQNCDQPLGVHVWDPRGGYSACPTGRDEFNPRLVVSDG